MENGFHTPPYSLFFREEPDYENLKAQTKILEIISEMQNLNICIIDLYKHNYFYVGQNHFFFNKYNLTEKDIIDEKTVDFFMYEKDRDNQLRMKDAALSFFMELGPNIHKHIRLFSTHRLKDKSGNIFLLSNQHKPFLYDDNGNIWMIICTTSISTKNHRIESYIERTDTKERYNYDPKRNKFICADKIKLTSQEIEILRLTLQGFTTKEIAENKNISVNTAKFHKKNILTRLKVQNMSEATLFAYSHNLI